MKMCQVTGDFDTDISRMGSANVKFYQLKKDSNYFKNHSL